MARMASLFFAIISAGVGVFKPTSLSQILPIGEENEYQNEPTAMAAMAERRTANKSMCGIRVRVYRTIQNPASRAGFCMAEKGRFELPIPMKVCLLSKQVH